MVKPFICRFRRSLFLTSVLVLTACSSGSTSDNPTGNQTSDRAFFLFVANDGIHGQELWRSDGTAAGTFLLKDVYPGPTSGVGLLSNFIAANDVIYFDASDAVNSTELWKSDGTADGTVMVKNINPASASIPITLYGAHVNGTLFFRADDGTHGWELWKSNGAANATEMVREIYPGPDSGPQPSHLSEFAVLGNAVYFCASDGVSGLEPWKSDGTASGTVMLKDISPISGESFPYGFYNANGLLYFWVNYGISGGSELWKSNGTETGTIRVKQVFHSPASEADRHLVMLNGNIFFAASDGLGVDGTELWKSDGTEAGTELVKDINMSSGSSSPEYLTVFKNTVFFIANDGVHGFELWKSDGTSTGTVMVKDIYPGPLPDGNQDPRQLIRVGERLFFTAYDGIHGEELWVSDGTEAGTVMVRNIDSRPGESSSPQRFVVHNGILYFSANDGAHGWELWRSDGTEIGTFMVTDICPGLCDGYQ